MQHRGEGTHRMKQLTCELCGSNDIAKQDGMFVCQHCGTKYSLEEARKMMVEGVVDVQGTVKVDNSLSVERFLANARRARQKEDWEETEKYYNLVEQNEPSNIEAIFYSSYGKAKMSLVDQDIYKRQQIFKVLTNCVSVLDDNYDPSKSEENKAIIEEISRDIILMCLGNFVFTEWKNGYGTVTRTNKDDTYTLFNNLNAEFITTLKNIAAKDNKPYVQNLIIKHANHLINNGHLTVASQNVWRQKVIEAHTALHAIDPSHEIPYIPEIQPPKTNKAGCVITAICIVIIAICIGVIIGLS